MYYSEKWFNGVLMYRTQPNGQWFVKHEVMSAIATLKALSDDDRKKVLSQFCSHCGTNNPPCVCMRDE